MAEQELSILEAKLVRNRDEIAYLKVMGDRAMDNYKDPNAGEKYKTFHFKAAIMEMETDEIEKKVSQLKSQNEPSDPKELKKMLKKRLKEMRKRSEELKEIGRVCLKEMDEKGPTPEIMMKLKSGVDEKASVVNEIRDIEDRLKELKEKS